MASCHTHATCYGILSHRIRRIHRTSCREEPPTDFTDLHRYLWCTVLPQNSQNTQNLAAWVWQGCHTLLICEHPCSSVGGSSLPEGSVCAFCENIFSPTDGTDRHRLLWCAVLPQNSQNTEFGSVGMAGMPYPPNLCSSAGEHRSLVGALETSAPPTE